MFFVFLPPCSRYGPVDPIVWTHGFCGMYWHGVSIHLMQSCRIYLVIYTNDGTYVYMYICTCTCTSYVFTITMYCTVLLVAAFCFQLHLATDQHNKNTTMTTYTVWKNSNQQTLCTHMHVQRSMHTCTLLGLMSQ